MVERETVKPKGGLLPKGIYNRNKVTTRTVGRPKKASRVTTTTSTGETVTITETDLRTFLIQYAMSKLLTN